MGLTIGQVARQAGITVETVRFYEKQGLLVAPQRTPAGYRLYAADTVKRLRFIKRAKEVGFSLKDIAELLELRREPGASCADVKVRAAHKIEEVDRRMRELQRIREALARMAIKCTGQGDLRECPILEALETDEE